MSTYRAAAIAAIAIMATGEARAHIGITSPVFADSRQVVTLFIEHGCEGLDTREVTVAIPESVTSVRALPTAWGEAELTTNAEGLVTLVTWAKPDTREVDDHYYAFSIRIAVPDAPFTKLHFPVTQVCRAPMGTDDQVVEWKDTSGAHPAPSVKVLPKRSPGWNRYTLQDHLHDLSYFDDAQIVWAGSAAYSANPHTMTQIENEAGVTVLSELHPGAEIWVKY